MDTNYKVLMTLMGLNIGGAETHVLELSKALARRGLDVYVASNGGDYEIELKEAGIKHYKVPLHNKYPGSLIKSYQRLKKIIRKNDIRLVHAHARIPAFICGLLQKKLGFRFATTAHWVFNTAFPYRILANWGERSLAVSDDIQEYLVNKYAFDKKNIFVTVNGIDTEKFAAKNTKKRTTVTRILTTNRLDKSRSMPSRALIEAAEDLYKHNPNIEIICIGAGDDFEEIKARAAAVNKRIGKVIVKLPGKRTDINECLAKSDIFVGVSRSAMEAMACGLPCVIAGNEGYIGILDGESKLDTAIQTNFCCRGCEAMTTEKIRDDVITLLKMDATEKKRLSEFGRKVIVEHYSVERMADDALAMYETLRKPEKKTDMLVLGYYGSRNNGDDALLRAIIDSFRKKQPDLNIEVISTRPKETEAIYGVKSINKVNLPGIINKLSETKLFIVGGGTLIQDLTSSRSLIYYLFVINMAVNRRVRTMLFSNGIGPVSYEKNKPRVKSVLNKVDLIALREPTSAEVLKSLEVDKPPIYITADIAFALNNDDPDAGARKLKKIGLPANESYFCVAIRQWKNLPADFEKNIADFVSYIHEKYKLTPVFIVMQPHIDTDITKRVYAINQTRAYVVNASSGISEMLGIIGGARFILGMRLHAIIYAVMSGVPVIGLVYDPKVRDFLDMISQTYYTDIACIKLDKLKEFADIVMLNRDEISAEIREASKGIRERALYNTELAFELLNKREF